MLPPRCGGLAAIIAVRRAMLGLPGFSGPG